MSLTLIIPTELYETAPPRDAEDEVFHFVLAHAERSAPLLPFIKGITITNVSLDYAVHLSCELAALLGKGPVYNKVMLHRDRGSFAEAYLFGVGEQEDFVEELFNKPRGCDGILTEIAFGEAPPTWAFPDDSFKIFVQTRA